MHSAITKKLWDTLRTTNDQKHQEVLFVFVDGQADQKASHLNASTHFRIISLFASFKHKVRRKNHRFFYTLFSTFKVILPVMKGSIDDFEGASSFDRSDILSIYSVRVCFNLTLSGTEHVWCWCGWQLLVERHRKSTEDSNKALPWRQGLDVC